MCQRWRLLVLALPASRVTLDFADSVWGADEPGFVAALLQALGGRPVGLVEIEHAPGSLPPQFWSELGEGLVASARGCAKRSLAGGAALPVVVFCMNRSNIQWPHPYAVVLPVHRLAVWGWSSAHCPLIAG